MISLSIILCLYFYNSRSKHSRKTTSCTSITSVRLRRIIAFKFDCRVHLFVQLSIFSFNSNNLLREAVVGLKLFYPKSFRKQFCAFLKAGNFIAPAGFWTRGKNPRRHHRTPRVYIYKGLKNRKYMKKYTRNVW